MSAYQFFLSPTRLKNQMNVILMIHTPQTNEYGHVVVHVQC